MLRSDKYVIIIIAVILAFNNTQVSFFHSAYFQTQKKTQLFKHKKKPNNNNNMESIHINKRQVEHVDTVVMETVGFPDSVGRKWDIKEKDARYWSLFGAPLLVITAAWQMIKYLVCDDYEIKHLLWGLVFLKVYAKNQTIHCSIVGWPTVKEFSSRSWYIIRILDRRIRKSV